MINHRLCRICQSASSLPGKPSVLLVLDLLGNTGELCNCASEVMSNLLVD